MKLNHVLKSRYKITLPGFLTVGLVIFAQSLFTLLGFAETSLPSPLSIQLGKNLKIENINHLVVVHSEVSFTPQFQMLTDPPRAVFDLPDVTIPHDYLIPLVDHPSLTSIRVGRHESFTRIVLDYRDSPAFPIRYESRNNSLTIFPIPLRAETSHKPLPIPNDELSAELRPNALGVIAFTETPTPSTLPTPTPVDTSEPGSDSNEGSIPISTPHDNQANTQPPEADSDSIFSSILNGVASIFEDSVEPTPLGEESEFVDLHTIPPTPSEAPTHTPTITMSPTPEVFVTEEAVAANIENPSSTSLLSDIFGGISELFESESTPTPDESSSTEPATPEATQKTLENNEFPPDEVSYYQNPQASPSPTITSTEMMPVAEELTFTSSTLEVLFAFNKRPIQDFTLRSRSSVPIYMTASVEKVLNPGSPGESFVTTSDLLISPRRFVLHQGQQRGVRLFYARGAHQDQKEGVYRVTLIPRAKNFEENNSSAGISKSLSVMVIVQPPWPKPELTWEWNEGNLLIKNLGNSNVMLDRGKICVESQCSPLPSRRLYPKSDWSISTEAATSVEFLEGRGDEFTQLIIKKDSKS